MIRHFVTRDGVKVSPEFEAENDAFVWLLNHVPYSVAHATKHEGYAFATAEEEHP